MLRACFRCVVRGAVCHVLRRAAVSSDVCCALCRADAVLTGADEAEISLNWDFFVTLGMNEK